CRYFTKNFNYFTKCGLNGPRPLPIVGNLWERLLTPLPDLELKWQRKYGKIYGIFEGNKPLLQVAEPELIKQILVKDSHIFTDRKTVSRSKQHPIVGKMLGELQGEDWKRVRSITTPVFTSGKMRRMYPLVRQSVEGFMNTLSEYAKDKHEVNVKDMYGCLTMDVIANCAFATKINAFKDPNNAFVVNGRDVFKVPVLKLMSMLLLPQFVLNILKFKTLMNEKSVDFFSSMLRQILRVREKSETKFHDLIDLLMRAKEGKDSINDESDRHESHHINQGKEELQIEKKVLSIKRSNKFLTEDEMIGQGFIVFIAGYETTATTLSFCSYELALNPDVQQKLYEEVMSSMDTNGEIDYEVLIKLPFLDAVIAETLRLHSPFVKIGKIAAQDYRLGNTGITVFKGQVVEIPVHAIHHSENYYPNPEMFIPDRFLPENRHKIIPYTYLPFSSGPRNCIGMRFALMEAKLGLAHIIRRFQFTRSPQTEVPLILRKISFINTVKAVRDESPCPTLPYFARLCLGGSWVDLNADQAMVGQGRALALAQMKCQNHKGKLYLTRNFNYFTKLGLKGPRPLPIFGNLWERFFTSQPEMETKWQQKYGNIYGIFSGNTPLLQVAEPKLIKQILVKDFHIFVDRNSVSKSKKHPIVGKMLTELQGEDWKRVRSITTPVFTSGKMRRMYPLVRQSVEGFMNTLSEYVKDKHEIDVKDMYGCLTMDVIANCAFATKTNAFKDPNNPFVVHERNALKFSFLKFISMLLLPQTLMNEKSVDFFSTIKSKKHPIVGKMLTELQGEDWKRVRSITTPVFTSGKMRRMYPLVRQSVEGFMNTLSEYVKDKHEIDVKDMYGCLTMDVIANCAFATKTNAFKDPNNVFVVNARNVFKFPVLKLMSMLLLPQFVLNRLKFKTLMNEKSVDFFSAILRQILRVREKLETKSIDLIDLMMRAKEGKDNINDESDRHESHHINQGEEELEIEKKILNIKTSNKFITEDEIIAQGFLVFVAGYETTATTLSFCSYELALNPDVQQKLYEEVMSSMDINGEIDYEVLTKLPFLDAVIAETLRLHSPVVKLGKIAAQDYKLGNTGITIYKGQVVEIPVHAIHHSEDFYPNPEKFIPDRFLPENRHKIIPYTYLPFGSGPRNCIGMRFALMEAKLGLAHIIRRFKFTRSPQTEVPLLLLKNSTLLSAKSMIVGIKIRD
ncbi:unnamed protein product, partial [Medioppia subpectinata]